MTPDPAIAEVLDFWFAETSKPFWFKSTPEFDAQLEKRFGALHARAAADALDAWIETADGALALILLLDQVPRNIFRASPRAFATDAAALATAHSAIERGHDRDQPGERLSFLYMPFQHSEDARMQAHSCALFAAMGDQGKLDFAVRHRKIIDRFGRFPHRNAVLGRASTAEEIAFLAQPNSSF